MLFGRLRTGHRQAHWQHNRKFVTEEIGFLAGLTYMECEAVKAARQSLYDALVRIGVEAAFNDCTAEQIDSVIEAVWNGLRESMQLQSARGEIPV